MWKIEKIVKKGDYLYAVVKDHPSATKHGYVLAHRIVMENHLGRLLNSNEIVHHKNGDKRDNRISNLEVMLDTEHKKLHSADKTSKWVRLRCPNCKTIFEREKRNTHLIKGGSSTFCSRECNGKFNMTKRFHGETTEMKSAVSGNIVTEFQKKWSDDNPEETI